MRVTGMAFMPSVPSVSSVPSLVRSSFCRSLACFLGRLLRALIAGPKQHKLVPIEREALGREVCEVARAPFDFKDSAARAAVEVVMMCLPGELVSGRLPRNLDLLDDARLRQKLQCAIDRRHAKASQA